MKIKNIAESRINLQSTQRKRKRSLSPVLEGSLQSPLDQSIASNPTKKHCTERLLQETNESPAVVSEYDSLFFVKFFFFNIKKYVHMTDIITTSFFPSFISFYAKNFHKLRWKRHTGTLDVIFKHSANFFVCIF